MNKTEERLSDRQPLVDASVHVFFKGNAEIREWLDEPWKSRGIGPVEMSWYSAPDGEYAPTIVDGASGSDDFALGGLRKSISAKPGEYPGSDPRQVGLHLFGERGVDIAILHPMTRGVYPDFTSEPRFSRRTIRCWPTGGSATTSTASSSEARSASTPTTSTAR